MGASAGALVLSWIVPKPNMSLNADWMLEMMSLLISFIHRSLKLSPKCTILLFTVLMPMCNLPVGALSKIMCTVAL